MTVDLEEILALPGGAERVGGLRPGWAVLDPTSTYRYLLGRRWSLGPSLAWVMLNPSTADADLDDQTIRQVRHYSRREGYGQAVVANLFAYRTADPAELVLALDHGTDIVGPANPAAVRALAGLDIVVAWGANIDRPKLRRPARAAIAALLELDPTPRCLGVTTGGHPRHPARLGHSRPLEPWSNP